MGSVYQHYLLAQIFVFALQALSSPAPMSFLHAETSSEVFPSSLSLPSEGRNGGGRSRDALVLLPEGFPLLPLDFGPAGGVEEPLVARSVHASSLLSPRFIRGLGIQELLSCGGLLLHVLSRLPLPPHLCTLGEVVGRVSLPSAAPVRVLPGLPIFGLGSREGALSLLFGRMALVIGLVAHAVAPLSVLG